MKLSNRFNNSEEIGFTWFKNKFLIETTTLQFNQSFWWYKQGRKNLISSLNDIDMTKEMKIAIV